MVIVDKHACGLGSNFLKAIDWLWYCKAAGHPVYIQWDEPNIFNELFPQKVSPPTQFTRNHTHVKQYVAQHFETHYPTDLDNLFKDRDTDIPTYSSYDRGFLFCQSKLYHDPNLPKIRKMFKELFDEQATINSTLNSVVVPDNTLGIHCRYLGHFFTNGPLNGSLTTQMTTEQFYARNIADIKAAFEASNYKHIYVSCHVQAYFDKLKEAFKDKLMYQDYKRWDNEHVDTNDYSLGEYSIALIDILNLSKCSHFINSISNFSFTTLILNPNLTFNLLPSIDGLYGG